MGKYKVKLLKRVINNKTWFSTYQHKHRLKTAAQKEAQKLRRGQKGYLKYAYKGRMKARVIKSGKFWFVFYR